MAAYSYASRGGNVTLVTADKTLGRLVNGNHPSTKSSDDNSLPVVAIGSVTGLAAIMIIFLIVSFVRYHWKHKLMNTSPNKKNSRSAPRVGALTSAPIRVQSAVSMETPEIYCVTASRAEEEDRYIDDESCVHFIDMDPIIVHYSGDFNTPLLE